MIKKAASAKPKKEEKSAITIRIDEGPNAGLERTFSAETHGPDFKDRAKSFAEKFGGKEVKPSKKDDDE